MLGEIESVRPTTLPRNRQQLSNLRHQITPSHDSDVLYTILLEYKLTHFTVDSIIRDVKGAEWIKMLPEQWKIVIHAFDGMKVNQITSSNPNVTYLDASLEPMTSNNSTFSISPDDSGITTIPIVLSQWVLQKDDKLFADSKAITIAPGNMRNLDWSFSVLLKFLIWFSTKVVVGLYRTATVYNGRALLYAITN